MKKLISLLVCLSAMASLFVPVQAADSDKMKTALAAVKARIEIPAELEEFKSSSFDGDEQRYGFEWSGKETSRRIYVEADEQGRISYYSESRESESNQMLADTTFDAAKELADKFLRKAAPELFENESDCLVYSASDSDITAYGGTSWFGFSYVRMHDGAKVAGNTAQVTVEAYGDKAYVEDVNISWDYDSEFEEAKSKIEDPQSAYLEKFPAKLFYEQEYSRDPGTFTLKDGTDIKSDVTMKYGFSDAAGYINAETGEVISPDSADVIKEIRAGAASGQEMKDAASDNGFSEQEIEELTRVEKLISTDLATRTLRSVSGLGVTADMTCSSVRIYSRLPWYLSDSKDASARKYVMSITLSNEKGRGLSAELDAQSGEILSVSNFGGESTAALKTAYDAENAVNQFIKEVCMRKSAQCAKLEVQDGEYWWYAGTNRLVNGIEYKNNGITITYDKRNGRISYYSSSWDDDVEYFEKPDKAIGLEAAKEKMLELVPLELIYIKNDGKFRLCYGLSKDERYAEIDAVTGEAIVNDSRSHSRAEFKDISGHWAQSAINRLCDAGICDASEENFRPDDKMTQSEMLHMFAAAFTGAGYSWEEQSFYDMLLRNGYIKDGEKNPGAHVAREDAFVFMVRFMGYERIAKISGIFNNNWADKGVLSADKVGYAAILNGLGIVSGDADSIRARDELTRAEAAMMIYKYLTYKD